MKDKISYHTQRRLELITWHCTVNSWEFVSLANGGQFKTLDVHWHTPWNLTIRSSGDGLPVSWTQPLPSVCASPKLVTLHVVTPLLSWKHLNIDTGNILQSTLVATNFVWDSGWKTYWGVVVGWLDTSLWLSQFSLASSRVVLTPGLFLILYLSVAYGVIHRQA